MGIGTSFTVDDFRAWVDGASIQIKAVTGAGDPVDLSTEEVREIIAGLSRLIQEIDGPSEGGFAR